MSVHTNPIPGQVMFKVENLGDYNDESRTKVTNPDEATVVSSLVEGSWGAAHKPVLDIDLPVTLTPSSTPGHFHLFIDKELTTGQYYKLLDVLAEVGIIEPGYRNASIERGHTAVRVPWVRKELKTPAAF